MRISREDNCAWRKTYKAGEIYKDEFIAALFLKGNTSFIMRVWDLLPCERRISDKRKGFFFLFVSVVFLALHKHLWIKSFDWIVSSEMWNEEVSFLYCLYVCDFLYYYL